MPLKYTGDFNKDFNENSPLIPEMVLESVVSGYADDDGQHADLSIFLVDKFKRLYANNARFGAKFAKQDNKARDLLRSFGRHWSESWLKKNYPAQYAKRVKTYESQYFEFTKRA